MSLKSLSLAIVAQMATAGVKNPMLASEIVTTPSGPYTVVYVDTGFAHAERYDGYANRVTIRWQVMSVTNSKQGVMDMAGDVRAALTGFSPGGTIESGRLSEEFAGPAIRDDKAPLDSRYSLTLNYIMTTHRGEV